MAKLLRGEESFICLCAVRNQINGFRDFGICYLLPNLTRRIFSTLRIKSQISHFNYRNANTRIAQTISLRNLTLSEVLSCRGNRRIKYATAIRGVSLYWILRGGIEALAQPIFARGLCPLLWLARLAPAGVFKRGSHRPPLPIPSISSCGAQTQARAPRRLPPLPQVRGLSRR